MDRRKATKTRGEREDEEVERLVRPSPKIKPPRHDLRRETVEVDDDPDLDQRDKDLSKNFKDIGGSIAGRVLARWARNNDVERQLRERVQGKNQRVRVRSKSTGWVGWISKEKFKGAPAEYELADTVKSPQPKAQPKGQPSTKPQPKAPAQSKKPQLPPKAQPSAQPPPKAQPSAQPPPKAQPSAQPPPKAQPPHTQPPPTAEPEARPSEAPQPRAPQQAPQEVPREPEPKELPRKEPGATPEAPSGDEADRQAQKQLRALGKSDPAFQAFLKALKNPKSEVAQLAKGNPAMGVKPFMQGKEPPEGVKTIGDLARVVNLPPAAKQAPAETPTSVAPSVAAPPAQIPGSDEPAQPSQQTAPGQQTAPVAPAQPQTTPQPPSQSEPAAGPNSELKYKPRPGENPRTRATRNELQALIDKNADLGQALKDFADPKSEAAKDAKQNPWFSARKYLAGVLHGDKLPADIDNIADLQLIMALPAQKKPAMGKGKAKGKSPETGAPTYRTGQPERTVSSSEREEAVRQISRTFPPKIAAELLVADPPYHPDEVRELIKDYNIAKALPATDIGDLVKNAADFYVTNPGKVPQPKVVDAPEGNGKVKLADLAEPDRAKALRKHAVQTVAMSLGVKSALTSKFEKQGAPPDLSDTLSDFMLSRAKDPPASRSKQADQAAEKIFIGGLARDPKAQPLSDGAVKSLLRAADDPAVKKLVVGYCQAKDYQEARKLFLDPKSKDAISERQSPKAIASKLTKAAEFLRDRSARYPDGTQPQDTYSVFRNRVMKHLAALEPKKAASVQDLLDVEDNRYYDTQLKKHSEAEKQYQKHRAKFEQHYDQDYKAYSERLRNGGDPNEDPPPNIEDRLAQASVERPRPPVKPPNYDKLTKKPKEMGSAARELWKSFQDKFVPQPGLVQRVASRCSTYSDTCAMDRTAVYWGVDPYPKRQGLLESYEEWQQPHASDLGDSDYSKILKAARDWLKQPVLASNIDGVVRDTQLRAALDLALRSENYSHAIHPAVYNKLLARLAGVPEDETLLTVRSKTARNTMSKKVELETARADRLLAGLDRIASVVQANHQRWGMDFTAAKNLVNAIDKIADDLETSTYGERSLLNRQAQEIGHEKLAEVIEKDSDEKYIDTFDRPMRPHQTEADEPYMKYYNDDQSSAVQNGKTTSGRRLTK